METTITVIRVVSAEFTRRTLQPLITSGLISVAVLVLLGAWLTTLSAWWWLLEISLLSMGLVAVLLVVLVKGVLRRIELPLNKPQRQAVVGFVDKLERSMETIKTPYPMILFYIVRDTVRPRPDAFIKRVAEDSRTLGPDFVALRDTLSKEKA